MPAGIQNSLQLIIDIDADATGGLGFTVPRAGTVVGVTAIATAASGGGTALVSNAGAAVTAALVMAVVSAVTPAVVLTQANVDFAEGDEIRVVTANAADRGKIVVDFQVPTSPLVAV